MKKDATGMHRGRFLWFRRLTFIQMGLLSNVRNQRQGAILAQLTPIATVICDGKSQVEEVDSDLMSSSCGWKTTDHRFVLSGHAHKLKLSGCILGVIPDRLGGEGVLSDLAVDAADIALNPHSPVESCDSWEIT